MTFLPGAPDHYFSSPPGRAAEYGEAVLVEPMKSNLKASGTKRLTLTYKVLLSSFGFKFNLRRYYTGTAGTAVGTVVMSVTALVSMRRMARSIARRRAAMKPGGGRAPHSIPHSLLMMYQCTRTQSTHPPTWLGHSSTHAQTVCA
jgi:hypothetical protein